MFHASDDEVRNVCPYNRDLSSCFDSCSGSVGSESETERTDAEAMTTETVQFD